MLLLCIFTDFTVILPLIFLVFDYYGTAEKLRKQLEKLSGLKCDSMSLSLYGNGVITTEEREMIKDKTNHKKMEYLIVDVIICSLKLGYGKKYKSFLKAMENSEDSNLRSTAKNLGMLIIYCTKYY